MVWPTACVLSPSVTKSTSTLLTTRETPFYNTISAFPASHVSHHVDATDIRPGFNRIKSRLTRPCERSYRVAYQQQLLAVVAGCLAASAGRVSVHTASMQPRQHCSLQGRNRTSECILPFSHSSCQTVQMCGVPIRPVRVRHITPQLGAG